MSEHYHTSIMTKQCIDALCIKPDGIYVDATFGGGGHSKAILDQLGSNGKLFGIDQDPDALKNTTTLEGEPFQFIPSNFRHIKRYLKLYGVAEVDGIMVDLGVSSHQIDQKERGFSTRFDGPLDMRMDPHLSTTAADIINLYSSKELTDLFKKYGEVKNARVLTQKIIKDRAIKPYETTQELATSIRELAPRGKSNKYLAQVFQAIRIQVNDELGALKSLLEEAATLLKKGGRMVVLTFHSLEDRIVKNFFMYGNSEGEPKKDLYGNLIRPFKPVTRKPIIADETEILENNRARSAKLRIAEKTTEQ